MRFNAIKPFRSIDNWGEGLRIFKWIGELLQMNRYLTLSRVDRHEISFRVENNPENRRSEDVARLITDSNFKKNLRRLKGIIVVDAGVGDKV